MVVAPWLRSSIGEAPTKQSPAVSARGLIKGFLPGTNFFVSLSLRMIRVLTADLARRVVRAAVGEKLSAHYKISEELPSLLRPLISLINRQDALGAGASSPPQTTPVQSSAAGETGAVGEPREKLKRKVAALRARAEEVRTTGDTMHDVGAREAMFRLAETYEKLASTILKSLTPE